MKNLDTRFHEGRMGSREPVDISYHDPGTFEECSRNELLYIRTADSYGVATLASYDFLALLPYIAQ